MAVVVAAVLALLIVSGVALAAYLQTESSYLDCGYPYSVRTIVHADGPHYHKIASSDHMYGDVGYTHYTYWYSSVREEFWTTKGGHVPPGYYDAAASGGWCYWNP
ncbi:MAG: hypothetical protein WA726_10155 [Acidimicrobiia bacterium]